jgi:hypothetical protein
VYTKQRTQITHPPKTIWMPLPLPLPFFDNF